MNRLRRGLSQLSLRARLILIALALMVVALTVSATVVGLGLRTFLLDRTDTELRTYAEPAQLIALEQAITGQQPALQPDYTVRFYTLDGSKEVTAINAVTEVAKPLIPALSTTNPHVLSGQPFTVGSQPGGGDTEWRVIAGVNSSHDAVYAVAVPLTSMYATVTSFVASSVGIGLAVTALGSMLAWLAITRAFAPLRRIEDTAAAIAGGDLSRRADIDGTSGEIAALGSSFNTMLGRIEQAFAVREASEERMRQFVADASHELRTPLATVRGYAELYRHGAVQEPDDVAAAMARIEHEGSRMASLVEDLLVLARLDSARPLQLTEVDLAVVSADTIADARARAPERAVRLIGLDGRLQPLLVVGDEARLRQVLTNLVANALTHTPEGTPVEVAIGSVRNADGATARIEVRDHGPGIDPEASVRVFERFYRSDRARSRATSGSGGSGLGLAIVAAIVALHCGKVGVADTAGGGATFVVELPQVRHSNSSVNVHFAAVD